MVHRDGQGRWRGSPLPPAHGLRMRIVVTTLGFLFGMGALVALLRIPGPTAQQATTRVPDNPAKLGVTGALPDDPLRDAIGAAPFGIAAASPAPAPTPHSDGITPPPIPIAQPVPAPISRLAAAPPPATMAPQATPSQDPHVAAARQTAIVTTTHLPDGPLGIPGVMLGAYQRAAHTLAASQPGCHLSWSVLAGIGRIESGHASGGRVDANGNTLGPILGPVLDGSPGMATIPDTDHGVLDGNTVWDRAVGPMQFIPASWRQWGVGNPNNIYDSTLAAGRYLCAADTNLSDPAQLQAAIYRYNHSTSYVAIVLQWADGYLTGVVPQPSAPEPVPPGTNGNGGRPILIDSGPRSSAAPTATPRPTPPPATPVPARSPSPMPTPTAPIPSPLPTPAIPPASKAASLATSPTTTPCIPRPADTATTCTASKLISRRPTPQPTPLAAIQ